MHASPLTAPEQRVLGCLIEKRFTTPEQYPLSLNALRNACNQSTNRDPVVSYDEDTVYRGAQRLCQYGLARLASGHSSRATKYRHLAEEGLGVQGAPLAVLCVLLLRGPQTPGELKARTERMAPIASLDEVETILGQLADRGYAQRLGRRPGQKEDRFVHLLGGDADATGGAPMADATGGADRPPTGAAYADPATAPSPTTPAPAIGSAAVSTPATSPPAPDVSGLEARVSTLEAEVASLRDQLDELLS